MTGEALWPPVALAGERGRELGATGAESESTSISYLKAGATIAEQRTDFHFCESMSTAAQEATTLLG